MCGIAGYFNLEFDPNEVIKVLRHRGPDEQNYWQGDGLTLISTRLSIQGSGLDGRQPMVMDGNVLVYNGELYNHGALKVRYDIKTSGKSDTEFILRLLNYGDDTVIDKFDGMFALGFYNSVEKKITLARDYFGEKPLYYFWDGSVFAFASELKAIYKIVRPEISEFDINSFLATGFFLGARTCYKNVFQLEPGKKLDFDLTKKAILISEYSVIGQSKTYVGNKSEAKEEGLKLLRNSVISRLTNSDREVGIYLSGGIDSGLITALASAEKHRLKTFTIAFDGLYNESPLAKKVSERYATDHREIHINLGHVSEDLETILGSYGEPMVDDSAIPSFYVAREASKYVSVVLSGDGGDELFAGYRRYIPFSLFKLFQSRPKAHSDFLLSILPRPGRKIHLYNYFYRLLNLRSTSPENIYFAATLDLLYDKPEVFKHGLDLSSYFDAFSEIANLDFSNLKKILRLDRSNIL